MNELTPNKLQAVSRKRRQALLLVAGLLAVPGLVLLLAWNHRRREEAPLAVDSDPRLTFATPYRNVRTEVQYTGDEVCARCHPAQAETYSHHPMGRSLAPVATATAAERFGKEDHNPFQAQGFEYLIERRGAQVFHWESRPDRQGKPVYEMAAEIRYVLGSGTKGRAYLIDRDGYLFQSPISWYSQKGAWDLSAGYQSHNHHFGRMVQTDCLFCHSNHARPVEGAFNRFRQPVFQRYAIGCERCHGPGELHVRRREQGDLVEGLDDTIVNPGNLEPALREAVCQQCHLQGEARVVRRGRELFDYRPGLPLHLFIAAFVRPPEWSDNHRAVSHVQQMYASRCFRASQGKLGCISCHDPHVLPSPEERAAYYRSRCLACHDETSCSLPPAVRRAKNQDDACHACHMPRLGGLDIAHTAETDHRILREAKAPPPVADGTSTDSYLIPFHADLANPGDKDNPRDMALALASVAEHRPPDALRFQLAKRALPLLEQALRQAPEDVPCLHAKGIALRIRGDSEAALAALEAALALAPRRELTLVEAASAAAAVERDDLALAYWQRALQVNPWCASIHVAMAKFLSQRRRWDEALRHCQAALRLDPADLDTGLLQVSCYLSLEQRDRARTEFDRILRFEPPNQEELKLWFSQQLADR